MKLILKADKELETEFYFKRLLAQTTAQAKTTTTTLNKIFNKTNNKKTEIYKTNGEDQSNKSKEETTYRKLEKKIPEKIFYKTCSNPKHFRSKHVTNVKRKIMTFIQDFTGKIK